jgi:hypothetical protein
MFTSGWFRRLVVSAGLVLVMAGSALAQSATPPSGSQPDGWKFTVYPILAWVPTNIGIEVNVPIDGGGGEGGGGEDGGISGEIVDSRFDGAYLGGFSATNGTWRIDVDGLWAAVGGDRPTLPNLTVDVDYIYGHGSVGRSIYKDLYVTAGVRRIALKYDISIADVPPFTRKRASGLPWSASRTITSATSWNCTVCWMSAPRSRERHRIRWVVPPGLETGTAFRTDGGLHLP